MNYQAFAALYDTLMEDAPYDKWIDYLRLQLNQQQFTNLSILDVGCGTGELLVRLQEEGADTVGVDLSLEMLSVAKEKCEQKGFSPPLFHQSMTDLEGLGTFEVVTIFCDSLNYLETEEEVYRTFESVHRHLQEDGLFLFDVHSLKKIEEGFIGQTFAEDGADLAYIWTSFEGDYPHSVEHELTFFIRDESHGYYERMLELHKQRTFPVKQYTDWLMEAGFSDIVVHSDFTSASPTEQSERIFFTARKKIKG
ncbi:class I SAM-dependent DNA methyltransferase [Halalkalibacter kiskunsagensis]|uniref:Class I SAM-dependent DNA methyltransferase n=1 Tax=Halalkalibacter kiskunsagensis TaxID=1548599 RepID=A0ABV6KJD2_9BACI